MKLIIILILSMSTTVFSKKQEKIVYKKRQKVDLGALSVDGKIVSPGDFTVSDDKQGMSKGLYKRKSYNDRLRMNIEYLF